MMNEFKIFLGLDKMSFVKKVGNKPICEVMLNQNGDPCNFKELVLYHLFGDANPNWRNKFSSLFLSRGNQLEALASTRFKMYKEKWNLLLFQDGVGN